MWSRPSQLLSKHSLATGLYRCHAAALSSVTAGVAQLVSLIHVWKWKISSLHNYGILNRPSCKLSDGF